MIRILHVVSVLQAGGMENFIMNLYRNIDREKIQFDFIVHHERRCLFEDEIESLGGKVYRFPVLDDYNVIKYWRNLNRFFRTHKEYRIVHGHLSSLAFLYLSAAKRNGVRWRIMHAHNTATACNAKGRMKRMLSRLAKYPANILFACSAEAGKYLFGDKQYAVIPNAIDIERFSYNARIRKEMRDSLKMADDFVIGHVGRFNYQKNHLYLLEIFRMFLERVPNAKLLLLGDGELKSQIMAQTETKGMSNKVVFAGVQKDCEKYYHAMDAFVLPSFFEGLPLTGIEAQYSGLPCFFSDTISREVAITPNVKFIGIHVEHVPLWCDELMRIVESVRSNVDFLTTDAFDIRGVARNMTEKYTDMWEKI